MEMYRGKGNSATVEKLNEGLEERIVTSESGTRTTFLANSYEIVFCEANNDIECCFQYLLANRKQWFELTQDFSDLHGDEGDAWSARRIYPSEAKKSIARYLSTRGTRDFAIRIKELIEEEVLPSDSSFNEHLQSLIANDSHVVAPHWASAESSPSRKLAFEHLLTFRHAVSEAIKSNSADETVAWALPASTEAFVRNLPLFLQAFGDEGVEILRMTSALLQAKIGCCVEEFNQFCEVIDDVANSPKTSLNGSVDKVPTSMIGDDQNAVSPSMIALDSEVGIQNESTGLNSIGNKNATQSSKQLPEPIAAEKSEEETLEFMFDIFFGVFISCRESWNCDAIWQPKSPDQIQDLKRIIFGREMEFDATDLASRLTSTDKELLELANCKPTFSDFKKNYRHLLVAVIWQCTDATWDDCNTIMKHFLNKNYSIKNMRGTTSEFLNKIGVTFELRQGEAGQRSSPSAQVKSLLGILRAQSE